MTYRYVGGGSTLQMGGYPLPIRGEIYTWFLGIIFICLCALFCLKP